MTPTTRTTLISITVLAFTTADVMGWMPHLEGGHGCLNGILVLLYFVLIGILWTRGVQKAGRGLPRWIFLTAFAAPMVAFGLSLADFQKGFLEGWNSVETSTALNETTAKSESKFQLPQPLAPTMPPTKYRVAWIVLTLTLTLVLNRLERRGAEADHQRELAKEARSEALRGKLAPHFIFNALNTLHAQIEVDSKGAQATTERLADLFRQLVTVVAQPQIPLKQELAFVEAYLGIEQARLGDRLRVTVDIPEDLESVGVPPLSLQVMVENAIKHGVAPLEQGGEVRIGAVRRDGALYLWVEDPGPGFSTLKGTGTALDTLRQRLERPEDLEMGLVDGRHRVGFRWRQA